VTNFAELVDVALEEHVPLIRELLAYDSLCPASCTFVKNDKGELLREHTPSPLHWSRQVEWPWVLTHGEFDLNHRVLDIGGGWSVLKFGLANRCQRVHCIDIERENLTKAQDGIAAVFDKFDWDMNITQQVADVRDIPFFDNTFDRVVCVSVLEHVPDGHTRGLEEMIRVLKPGGHLLLTLDVAVDGPLYGKPRPDFFIDKPALGEILERLHPLDTTSLTRPKVRGLSILNGQLSCVAVMIKWTKPENK
jgi:SAM-dependent methyltransferase